MNRSVRLHKLAAWIVIAVLLLNGIVMSGPAYADTAEDLDLSGLSTVDVMKSEATETYAYTWTVEDTGEKTIRTLRLTLDGANINTLTLPCRRDGEIHVVINTVRESCIYEIGQSYLFSYSYQWNTITFSGEGKLSIDHVELQGGGNDHIITVNEGANVNVIGDNLYGINFGASGSNGSSLHVEGHLSVNGQVACGQTIVGPTGVLLVKGIRLMGTGAYDEDGEMDAFVLRPGGKLELKGDATLIDEETREVYAPFIVYLSPGITLSAEEIVNLPTGALPPGHSIYKSTEDNYVTFDDGGKQPKLVLGGIIYGATTLSLPMTYTIEWKNEDGAILETDEVPFGTMPSYDGETPVKAADGRYTYTFAGWNTKVVPVDGNKVYQAAYHASPITYVVSFDSDGGTKVPSQNVEAGQNVKVPAEPQKAGFTFKGWALDGILYDFEGVVTKDYVLTAIWEAEPESDKDKDKEKDKERIPAPEKHDSSETKKDKKAPVTGDKNDFTAWMEVMMASIIAGGMLLLIRQKRNETRE